VAARKKSTSTALTVRKGTSVTTRKTTAVRKTAGRRVRIYAMPTTPAIHVGDDVYPVLQDRSLLVPSELVSDFLKMGCTREPQE
jgi:hypothetical protein